MTSYDSVTSKTDMCAGSHDSHVIYLQLSGSEVDTGTGNGLWGESDKHVCAETVVHVVPTALSQR